MALLPFPTTGVFGCVLFGGSIWILDFGFYLPLPCVELNWIGLNWIGLLSNLMCTPPYTHLVIITPGIFFSIWIVHVHALHNEPVCICMVRGNAAFFGRFFYIWSGILFSSNWILRLRLLLRLDV